MLADGDVGGMPRRLRTAVHGEMLGSRNHAIVLRIITLHSRHKGHAHSRREKRIFSVSFLPASPARIAKDVDVRRPKIQSFEDIAVTCANCLRVFDSPFDSNSNGHLMNRLSIEGRRQPNRLRKLGSVIEHDAVKALAPPVIRWNSQSRNGSRLVYQLRDLL